MGSDVVIPFLSSALPPGPISWFTSSWWVSISFLFLGSNVVEPSRGGDPTPSIEADTTRHLQCCVLGAGMHSCDRVVSKQAAHPREAELALPRSREQRIHPPCSDNHCLEGAVTLVASSGQQGPEVMA